MANLRPLMEVYDASSVEGTYGRALVFCPEYCESEYEICEVADGRFTGQSNNEDITEFVHEWVEIESYL